MNIFLGFQTDLGEVTVSLEHTKDMTEKVKAKQRNDLVALSSLLGLPLNQSNREKEPQQEPLVRVMLVLPGTFNS